MSTSRTLIISSVLVGGISLMISSVLKFSVTGVRSFVPTLKPFFIINGIIFALAASTSLFGNESHDSPATKHHYDDDNHRYEHDHHDHDHDGFSNNSSNSSSDQYNNKVREETKFPVRSESGGSYRVSSLGARSPSTAPVKPVGLRRPPTAPLKTFQQDETSGEETETMEEMWERVKAEKQPRKPKTWLGDVISRKDTKMSSSSCPSPLRARKPPPSPAPGTGKKLMERIPSWVKLKKELSMGREELNSRVEAFITKFKDEMKLQRLESLRRVPSFFRRSSDENQ